jgi:hypothetical protein
MFQRKQHDPFARATNIALPSRYKCQEPLVLHCIASRYNEGFDSQVLERGWGMKFKWTIVIAVWLALGLSMYFLQGS